MTVGHAERRNDDAEMDALRQRADEAMSDLDRAQGKPEQSKESHSDETLAEQPKEIPLPASRPDDAPATDESTSVETVPAPLKAETFASGNSRLIRLEHHLDGHRARHCPRSTPPRDDSTVVIVEVPDHDAERRAAEAEARAAEPKKQPGVRSDMQHRQICNGRLPNRGPATAAGEIDNAESLISVLRIATPGV